MRALVQRVSEAAVTINGLIVGQIGGGACVFLGLKHGDTTADAGKLADKVVHLRIFPDEEGKMNRNLIEIAGELLIVPQFTLYGDTRHGNRPSYTEAASPEVAQELFQVFIERSRELCRRVAAGVFRAHMQVRLINDGPVTLMCYSGE